MFKRFAFGVAAVASMIVAGCLPGFAVSAGAYAPFQRHLYAPGGAHLPFGGSQHAVCAQPAAGAGHCLIHILQPGAGAPQAGRTATVTSPTGLSPATIESVYGYSNAATAGAGQTVAIVDAYNDPNAAGNLEAFSKQYGLPAASLTQVNQEGGSTLPATEAGWDLEISLDIEWAHALAPGAHILLVEAKTSSLANLLAAESYAAKHAGWVSNSWGASEFSGESTEDTYFTAPGVSFFAAAGDEGGKVIWPSASPDVTSVGGTSLTLTTGGTLAQEEAWSGGGGGCSRYEAASSFQLTGGVGCGGKRATPDISLDANPSSGVSVYDTVTYERQSGWWTVGGTSASTVMIAAHAATEGSELDASYLYASPANIPVRDVLLGSNGYQTLTGYDLATGLGSWSYTPGAPTGLTAGKSPEGAVLSWQAPSGAQPSEYVIWRGTSSGKESTKVATVPATQTSFTDSAATGSATYYYEVQAVNASGVGPLSNQAIAAPPSVPPKASFSTTCSGASCTFVSTSTDEAGTIDAFAWNGGNSLTSSGSSFTDTYSAAGSYTVTLTVTNTAGQSASATGKVSCTSTGSRGRFGRSALTCT